MRYQAAPYPADVQDAATGYHAPQRRTSAALVQVPLLAVEKRVANLVADRKAHLGGGARIQLDHAPDRRA